MEGRIDSIRDTREGAPLRTDLIFPGSIDSLERLTGHRYEAIGSSRGLEIVTSHGIDIDGARVELLRRARMEYADAVVETRYFTDHSRIRARGYAVRLIREEHPELSEDDWDGWGR